MLSLSPLLCLLSGVLKPLLMKSIEWYDIVNWWCNWLTLLCTCRGWCTSDPAQFIADPPVHLYGSTHSFKWPFSTKTKSDPAQLTLLCTCTGWPSHSFWNVTVLSISDPAVHLYRLALSFWKVTAQSKWPCSVSVDPPVHLYGLTLSYSQVTLHFKTCCIEVPEVTTQSKWPCCALVWVDPHSFWSDPAQFQFSSQVTLHFKTYIEVPEVTVWS